MKKSKVSRKIDSDSQSYSLDQTFKFDSTMLKGKKSILKNSNISHKNSTKSKFIQQFWESNDISHRTSQIVRYIDDKNQNILELLQESQNAQTTNKIDEEEHKQLWDFFGRFQRQTNPSVSLTQINFSREKKKNKEKVQKMNIKPPKKLVASTDNIDKFIQINLHSEFLPDHSTSQEITQKQIKKYPIRKRLKPLRYWLNQKPIYKNGELIGITSVVQSNQQTT